MKGNCKQKEPTVSFRKKDLGRSIDYAKSVLEKEQKKCDEAHDYVVLSREIVHHEKYLSELNGDDRDLIEARKRLQRAKSEYKRLHDYCSKLKNQISHYERVYQKSQKTFGKIYSFQDLN